MFWFGSNTASNKSKHSISIFLDKVNKLVVLLSIILSIVLVIIVVMVYLFKINLPIVYIVSSIYGILFIANIVLSIIYMKKDPINRIFIIGLILYFLCDLCIAVGNFFPSALLAQLIWVFYLPGEVLITTFYLINQWLLKLGSGH